MSESRVMRIEGDRLEPPRGRLHFPRPALVEWLCLVGGVYLTLHYAWFLDDAYIYFRYVDNLLFLNHGLVFNAGEYVEGFSSPLWTLVLIALRATGMNYWLITRLVGVAAFVVFWALLVILNRRLSPPRAAALNVPLCYLASIYAVQCYFTSGLESPLIQVAAVAYGLYVLMPASRGLELALAFTPLLRHELALPLVICILWRWIALRRVPWRLVCESALISGSWVVFRIYYYADLLPNTFYLKDTTDYAQGLVYLHDTAGTYWFYLFAAVMTALASIQFIRDRRAPTINPTVPQDAATATNAQPSAQADARARLLMLLLAASVALYVVRIGGDPRHYRYLAFPFCLSVCATGGLVERSLMRLSFGSARIIANALGFLLAAGAACLYPAKFTKHPFRSDAKAAGVVNKISDSVGHRRATLKRLSRWGWGDEMELRPRYAEARARAAKPAYVRVFRHTDCSIAYDEFEARVVQSFGLTDPFLARTIMPAERPAHKEGLMALARDLEHLIAQAGGEPRRGMYREAVARGDAPPWIANNLDKIEIIERKMLNTHDFLENVRLAFTFPGRIDPNAAPTTPAP